MNPPNGKFPARSSGPASAAPLLSRPDPVLAGTVQSQVLNRFRRYLGVCGDGIGAVRTATKSVGSMDATKALEDGSPSPQTLPSAPR